MPYEAANQHHPSGQGSVQATRNPDAERGVGRAFRHEADMLPIAPVNIRTQLAGMSACRASLAGPAVRQEQTLTPKKSLNVAVRSGNIDPRAVGINKTNWGMAGVGDDTAENMAALDKMIDDMKVEEKAKTKKLLIGGLLAVVAIIFINKSRHA
jgi:hypothetical protein